VAAYSGTTGSAQFLDTAYDVSRPIVRYLPSTRSIAWRSADKYRTVLAARGALIFAARNDPTPRLDAINVSDGSIAWSWTPPPGSKFRSNIVVSDNVLFVGTTTTTYGLSLADRSVVWSYGAPGALAVAPGNILLISESSPQDVLISNNKLTAFRLR
jgi:outer membrane protein assembly factor BamB